MLRRYFIVGVVLFTASIASAGEQLTLTTPVVKTQSVYEVQRVDLDWERATITIIVTDQNGDRIVKQYVDNEQGPIATTLIRQLNTLNLSTNSLQKRILQRLSTDGVLVGTVTGTPD